MRRPIARWPAQRRAPARVFVAALQQAIIRGCERLCEMRQVITYPGEDGYRVPECPSLPGCVSQGRTKEEAVANIRKAIQVYTATLRQDGLPVPDMG